MEKEETTRDEKLCGLLVIVEVIFYVYFISFFFCFVARGAT